MLGATSFSGPGLTPVWVTDRGRAVIAWWENRRHRYLLVGVDLVGELVRYTQGDPRKVATVKDKTMWGYGHERPMYLFEDHVVAASELTPWADELGWVIARTYAEAAELPLIAPLPGGARGAVILTGDDDQAELAKYERQQRLLDGFPITYLLLPFTRHTAATLAALPETVEFGVHVDALERPGEYAAICAEQAAQVRALTGSPCRTVRNHGHLNDGYWGHVAAWEQTRLMLDFNIRGVDGTCPTGSYLPFRVQRSDGSWSDHWSLFSTFSDGMYFQQKWSEAKQIECIEGLADQIERSMPGIIVANFHPQNVDSIPHVHQALMTVARRPGWIALGAESFADWLERRDRIKLHRSARGLELTSNDWVRDIAIVWPSALDALQRLPAWSGTCVVSASEQSR